MTTIQITEAQRDFILSNIGNKFDGTNGRELQIRTWKPSAGKERIYINLMVNGGSNASAWLTRDSLEINVDKGGEYYRTNLAMEIEKWLPVIIPEIEEASVEGSEGPEGPDASINDDFEDGNFTLEELDAAMDALPLRTLAEARHWWQHANESDGGAVGLLEAARRYVEERGVIIPAETGWEQAMYVLGAIAQDDTKAAAAALHLWRTSPGASGRLPHDESGRMISVTDAAERKGVSRQSVRDILRDDERRAAIFPSARFEGDSPQRGEWKLDEREVAAWQPKKYPRG